MESNEFFDFGSKLVSSTFQAHAVGLKEDVNGMSAHWSLLEGNYEGIKFPIVFRHEYGRKLADILDTGWPSLYLISDKMKAVLEQNKLTGWKSYTIELVDKKGNQITGYHGFSVTGRCTSTSFAKSQIINKQFVENGPICKFYKGMSIDGWDGTDFFSPENKGWIFVTKNAFEKLKQNKLTNVCLKNLADIEVDIRNIK